MSQALQKSFLRKMPNNANTADLDIYDVMLKLNKESKSVQQMYLLQYCSCDNRLVMAFTEVFLPGFSSGLNMVRPYLEIASINDAKSSVSRYGLFSILNDKGIMEETRLAGTPCT